MAIMTLPLTIPSAPSAEKPDNNDPKSTATSTATLPSPLTPTSSLTSPAAEQQPTQPKRKASRRANTAERRATHNAVERQRRETLNGRFLDLAALLPNLSQIRRPSKSSIVNSSIAHVHASRRHRLLASRELRMLKIEADTLRRELNEWRERAGISRIEEPIRGDGFAMVISGELEVIIGAPTNDNDDEDDDGENYGGYVGGDGHAEDEFGMDLGVDAGSPIEDPVVLAAMMKHPTGGHSFAHGVPPTPGGAGLPHGVPRPASMGGGATNVPATFEAMYDSYPAHISQSQRVYHSRDELAAQQMLQHAYIQQQQQHRERERALYQRQQEQEKMWGLYATNATAVPKYPHPHQIMMMQAAQRSLFTPPSTSHGRSCSPGSPASNMSDPHHHHQGRERSGSVSSRDSHSPSYELTTSPAGEYFTHPHSDFGAGVVPRSGGMLGMGGASGGMDMMGIGMAISVEGM